MNKQFILAAREVISRCEVLSKYTEEPPYLTRTFLSDEMRSAYAQTGRWMEEAGMLVGIDPAGNLRGVYPSAAAGRRLIIGSHLDTVPRAGKYDGILGVILGIELVRLSAGRKLNFEIEVIGFSDEEGVRFGVPFIGSKAIAGVLDDQVLETTDKSGRSIRKAIADFGLDPEALHQAVLGANIAAYFEFHIEQGPVLESLDMSLGVVDAIVGQSRVELCITGQANHAGTTPMELRRDALAGAAEWILAVESTGKSIPGLVATVGRAEVIPGAGNVVPGEVKLGLDVRHSDDAVRRRTVEQLVRVAQDTCGRRRLQVSSKTLLDQPAAPMNPKLTNALSTAANKCGHRVHQMNSGAGHDAMILAPVVPSAMLFLRSPGGLSHHSDEGIYDDDVAAALEVGMAFLEELEVGRWLDG